MLRRWINGSLANMYIIATRCYPDFLRFFCGLTCRGFDTAPNPPNFQNLKQVQKGDGLPSPYLLPDDPARLVVRPAGFLRPQDFSENMRSDKYEK